MSALLRVACSRIWGGRPFSWLANAQLGVLAALPVDDEHDLTGRLVDIDNDLSDQCPRQSLARPHRGSRRLPCRHEIIGQSGEVGTHIIGNGRLHLIEPLFATLDPLQCGLPRLLQLRCDQAVVGVASSMVSLMRLPATLRQRRWPNCTFGCSHL